MLWPSTEALTIGNWRSASTIDLGDERGERQLGAGRFVLRLLPLAQRRDPPEVDLVDRVDVRRRLRAEHHVLGDLPAHDAHRHDLDALARTIGRACAGPRRRRAALAQPRALRPRFPGLDERQDVALGDAAVDARALNRADVDVVFLRDAADERRRLLPWRILVVVRVGRAAPPHLVALRPARSRGRRRLGFRLPDGGFRQRVRRRGGGAACAR